MSKNDVVWYTSDYENLTKDDFHDIVQLRIEVFVIEQDCPYQDLDGKDQNSWHLWCRLSNGNVAAYIRIVKPGISYSEVSIGRVVTSMEARKMGLGKMIMTKGIDFIHEQLGKVPIRISAQCYLEKFYTDLGFKDCEKRYLEDGIPHMEMLHP